MNDLAKNIVLWIVIAVVVATVVSNFSARSGGVQELPYSTFLQQVKDGGIAEITLNKNSDVIRGVRSNGEQFNVYNPETENSERNSRPRNLRRPKYSTSTPISSMASSPSGIVNS